MLDLVHRIALFPSSRDWTYDFTARALVQHLSDRFEFSIFYNDTVDDFDPRNADLAVDFWWKGRQCKRYGERVAVQVSSHRWAREKYGSLSVAALINDELRRAGALFVPSVRLRDVLAPHFGRAVTICPKGFHPETFGDFDLRHGDLKVGWAGKADAPDKRVGLLRAAWPRLRVATDLSYDAMPAWYNSIDVITCASDAEGDPRTLIEGMACGCFPVVVDVGIVPELVRHGENGLIVPRTAKAFTEALSWCRANIELVREVGRRNAIEMRQTRTWKQLAPIWGDAFAAAIARAPEWHVDQRAERKARIKARLARGRQERALADRE